MSSMSKTQLIGRLGKDPEIRYTQAGKAVANLSIATSESWKDKQSGQRQERTEWHRVSLFDRLAEICGEYLKKGSVVYIEGQNRTRKYQDQNGQDRYVTEIIAQHMKMLGGGQQQGQGNQGNQGNQGQQRSQPAAAPQAPEIDYDDVPF